MQHPAWQIMQHPAGSLPEKLNNWAELMGLYRLAGMPAVTHARVMQPHCQHTLEQMSRQVGPVLLIHDATELDYTHADELAGQLGPIGNGGGRGYVCHNSLAVTPDRQVLGLANQILHR